MSWKGVSADPNPRNRKAITFSPEFLAKRASGERIIDFRLALSSDFISRPKDLTKARFIATMIENYACSHQMRITDVYPDAFEAVRRKGLHTAALEAEVRRLLEMTD
ncbi:hypothetical protein [Gloeobacter violaceus]|uniref:Glr3895 protein n=1 Tax=Gloeobacter violaceus (strain ATCC 29082 / PCC 7421) TaxID=251221 RepID=Q7NEI4_GLOVI|nr:hypothetical protein [Gloeobacter violaceus]BAC91836.1 glr3895 [Gloeobacter violaceus PCC 7421]